jgi:hypothetical protein
MRQTVAAGLVVFVAACGGNTIAQPSTWTPPNSFTAPSGLLRDFSLTFTADRACTSLPANVLRRTYSGTSDGTGPYRLGGAAFASFQDYGAMNIVSLAIFGTHAQAWFEDGPIIELVTPESTLMISGHAAGPIAGSSIELPVSATYLFCPKTKADGPGCSVPFIECESTNHRLTLTPR